MTRETYATVWSRVCIELYAGGKSQVANGLWGNGPESDVWREHAAWLVKPSSAYLSSSG